MSETEQAEELLRQFKDRADEDEAKAHRNWWRFTRAWELIGNRRFEV